MVFLSLSRLNCCVSSDCMLGPKGLVSESPSTCLIRCHLAPSMLRGPEANCIVAIPCVVNVLTEFFVVSQASDFSKIRTAPVPGGPSF